MTTPPIVQIDDAVLSAAIDRALTRWLTVNNEHVSLLIQSAVESSVDHALDQKNAQGNNAIRSAVLSAIAQWMSKNKAAMLNTIHNAEMESHDA